MRPLGLERRSGPCLLALLLATGALAAPPVELTDEGRTILYRLQAGDTPADLSRAFGLDAQQLATVLEAHGATDWRQARAGAVWRIPNPLATSLEALAARLRDAERRAEAAEDRVTTLAAELAAAQAAVTMDAAERARLAQLEGRWRSLLAAVGGLALACVVAVGFLVEAQRRAGRAVRWARGLAAELDERRRAALAERQQAARRLVELEERVRRYELAEAAARVRLVDRQG